MKKALYVLAGLALAAAPALAQQRAGAGVQPLQPGQVQIIASYLNANGRLVADTVRIQVVPVAVAVVELFNSFNPPAWNANATVGKSFCAYAEARDSAGRVLTGRPVVFTSSNTAVATITASALCPDTTINAKLLLVNPVPPAAK